MLPPMSTMRRMVGGTTGRVFMLLCLLSFITYIDRVNISVAAPLIRREFHLSNIELGFALSAFGYAYAVFQIVGGYAGDRFGARRTLFGFGILWACATAATGFVGGLGTLVAVRIVVGVGEGATLPAGTRAMTQWVPQDRRGFAQGFTHSCSRLAAAVTPLLVVALIGLMGWRGAFVALGGVSLLWVALWVGYFRNDPRRHPGITPQELAELPPPRAPERDAAPIPWLPLIRRMMPTALVWFCHAWTLWMYLAWLPCFFVGRYHIDIKHSAMFTSGVFLAGMVGDACGGLVTDAIYRRTGDLGRARVGTIVVSMLGALVFLAPVLLVRNRFEIALCLSASLFFLELQVGPIWAVPMDIAPGNSGLASAIMNTAAGIAASISPLAFGVITHLSGSYTLPFAASMVLLLGGAFLAFRIRPERGLPDPAIAIRPALERRG
jgi:MFS family permease